MTPRTEPSSAGNGDRPARAGDASWTPPTKHLSDYLRIVRDRWLVATIAFLAGLGWIAWSSLFATPVYESLGTLQVEDSPRGDSMLAELGAADQGTNVEAELLVMRSQMIAKAAAKLGKLYVGAEEVNAYRPFEAVLQQIGFRRPPCRLAVTADVPADEVVSRSYEIDVESSGVAFEVKRLDGAVVVRSAFGPDRRATLTLDGREVTIAVVDGAPAGKRFSLWLRTLDEAGYWIRQGVLAREEGQRTGMVSVGFQGSTPHLAQRAAAAVQQAYLDHKSLRKKSSLESRLAWLSGEKKRVKGDLDKAEGVLDAYIKEHGAVMLPERARASFDEQGRLLSQKLVLEQELRTLEAARKDLAEATSSDRVLLLLGQDGGVDQRSTALAASLSQYELEREVLRLRFKEEADELKPLAKKIDETRRLLEERTVARREFAVRALEQRIAATTARIKRLDDENQRQEDRLQALPKEEREIAQRTREVDATSRAFEMLTRWEGEARIALSSASSPVAAIDTPRVPVIRSKPVLSRQVALGLLVGVFLGVLAAFALNYLDRTVRTPSDLERAVGLPLYAAIPDFRTVRRRERDRIKRGHGGRLPTLSAPESVMAETYRSLRANLRFASIDHPVRSLAITSSLEQEGKTVTTCNLAVVLAQAGSRVVVVDADMRRPSAHTVFGAALAPGLADVLTGKAAWKSVVHPVVELESLHLLPAGKNPQNPGALLDSPTFRTLLVELTAAYDYVLFDVPPVLAVADAAAFFRQLDAVVLLTRYRRCTGDVVESARHQIERLGGNVVGVIFNAFDARKAARRGYGYYGYYGDYAARDVEPDAPT